MSRPGAEQAVNKAVDNIQERLTGYACALDYKTLTPEAIHSAKVRLIDTLGALIGGFFGEPCVIARNLAAQVPDPRGATVFGTRMKTTPDLAAFVNATTARYAEMTDSYHVSGGFNGHPSDTLMAVLSVAEHAQVRGPDLITAVVLAYEVFYRIAEVFDNRAFDNTNWACIASAVAAGKLLGLSPGQLSHCISMAVVPNNILKQVRSDQKSMFKAAAAGQAGRAGVFAALLARAGMEGPHLPFEGKAGWCAHIAGERFSLDALVNDGKSYKVSEAMVKNRPANGATIPTILAAEKVGPITDPADVKHIIVEVNDHAKNIGGNGGDHYNPQSREDADHSIPYGVAVALMEGPVTLRSFDDAHLHNPNLRALMQKIEIVENEEFTKAFARLPVEHRARVTVLSKSGERLVGETGGDADDMAVAKSDAQIEEKFRSLTADVLNGVQTQLIFDRLWHLEEMQNVSDIATAFVIL